VNENAFNVRNSARLMGLAMLAFLVLHGIPCPARAAAATEPDLQKLETRLESLRKKWNVPGMAAAVAQGDQILWAKGFGLANVAKNEPVTPDTVFHLASLTKPFAAAVLLRLREEGKLDLEAPVTQYGINLKGLGVVRVWHLLTHTSEGVPGEVFRYNGARFNELDKVVAGATGKSFAELARLYVLDPLVLTNTSPNPAHAKNCIEAGRDPEVFARRLAQGYEPDGVTEVAYKQHFRTAAGMVSTVGDMVRFSNAWDEGKILRPESRDLAFTPARSNSGKRLAYGLGWFVQERKSGKLVWHYGWWVGDSTLIVKVPERKLTFVLLANSDGLSHKFDLGQDNNVLRSPFAKVFVELFAP
jgi:CubicO group peptidase (beta-lactamase class C family)